MLLVKRFINTVRKCRPPGKRLASRTWKRADSPSASEQEIHKPQRPFGRLLFTLRPGGFFGPRRICGCKGTPFSSKNMKRSFAAADFYIYLTYAASGDFIFLSPSLMLRAFSLAPFNEEWVWSWLK